MAIGITIGAIPLLAYRVGNSSQDALIDDNVFRAFKALNWSLGKEEVKD